MNLADVMDDLGSALETITDLRVFPYWADRITPPAAVVTWPEITYDTTMVRGSDRLQIEIFVFVGAVDARTTRDAAVQYAAGSGTHSVKSAIESFAATAYDSVRVERAEFGKEIVAGVTLLAIAFTVDVFGQGS